MVSSADSLRSSRNSVQALLESRHCIPSTRTTWTHAPCALHAPCWKRRLEDPLLSHCPVLYGFGRVQQTVYHRWSPWRDRTQPCWLERLRSASLVHDSGDSDGLESTWCLTRALASRTRPLSPRKSRRDPTWRTAPPELPSWESTSRTDFLTSREESIWRRLPKAGHEVPWWSCLWAASRCPNQA